MNELQIYLLFNPEKKNLNINELKYNLHNDKVNNNKIIKSFVASDFSKLSFAITLPEFVVYSIESFFKKFPNFNIEEYKNNNKILDNLTTIDLLSHAYRNYKIINNENNIKLDKVNLTIDLSEDGSSNDGSSNDGSLNNGSLNNGSSNDTLSDDDIKYPVVTLDDINLFPNLNNASNENNNNNYQNKNTMLDELINFSNSTLYLNNKIIPLDTKKLKKQNIKIAHIFVHFFKIGGGESYLNNFNKYNKNNFNKDSFDETLFINENYENNTLFEFNMPIRYYRTYEILNKKLSFYDIIIDHQLFWFNIEASNIAFKNINNNKIMQITHGVPIHYENILKRNLYYSIELYNDYKSHISWNNHIKIYKNIGVNIPLFFENNKKIFDVNKDYINVAIIGRINEEKISKLFLENLLIFCNNNNKYLFNFYGACDDKYQKYFLYMINKNLIGLIKYNGITLPKNIENIYKNNDILMHPSKMEAGATVILEAMSYGLPIICRDNSGMINACGKYNFLCNNEKEMFDKLLEINNINYNFISFQNKMKILNENNQKHLFLQLNDDIKLIYDYEQNTINIPNIIHYVFGLKEQTEEFQFVYYLSIYSNYLINNPNIIYFHYQYLPYGYWWEKAKKFLKLNYVNANNLYWGKKKIIKTAHKADKIRLDILYKYGGIYMDIDTITFQSYHELLVYDFVIGIQERNFGKKQEILYCNAILFSKKKNIFIKRWLESYEDFFKSNGWCEGSVHLPGIILDKLIYEKKINLNKFKILGERSFYKPLYNEVDKIFEPCMCLINPNLITLHLWNTFSEKYYNNINNFDYAFENNNLYSLLVRNIIDINKNLCNNIINNNINININIKNIKEEILKLENSISKYINGIIEMSIIINIDDYLIKFYDKILFSLIKEDLLYKINLEIIIIDNCNGTKKLFDLYYYHNELKELFVKKNINLKIIEFNTENNYFICKNCGIFFSNNANVYYLSKKYKNEYVNQYINQYVYEFILEKVPQELIENKRYIDIKNIDSLAWKEYNNNNYLNYISNIYNF